MKTAISARIVIETDKYRETWSGEVDKPPLTLAEIKTQVNSGHYLIEWISADLTQAGEPILIIKI